MQFLLPFPSPFFRSLSSFLSFCFFVLLFLDSEIAMDFFSPYHLFLILFLLQEHLPCWLQMAFTVSQEALPASEQPLDSTSECTLSPKLLNIYQASPHLLYHTPCCSSSSEPTAFAKSSRAFN